MHLQYDDNYLKQILTSVKTIALVGASPKPDRASHRVMAYLQARGYRVIPINPACRGEDLLKERVFSRLEDIPESMCFAAQRRCLRLSSQRSVFMQK